MTGIINRLKQSLRRRLRDFLGVPPNLIGAHGCIRAAASFAVWNQVPGDYLEFGVWEGRSFAVAYDELMQTRAAHIRRTQVSDDEYEAWKSSPPRFFAFDSFEGIQQDDDAERMVDYHPGAYACTEERFLNNVAGLGVDLERVVTVKGYYDQTCTPETRAAHQLDKAAIVHIDCDLYESTVPVLDFVTDILQQGSIIIFDDWYRFQGRPDAGEQRACNEWLARNPHIELIPHWQQGPQSKSFLVNFRQPANERAS